MRSLNSMLSQFHWRVAFLGFLSFSVIAHGEEVKQLRAQGYVNDFAGVLNAQTQADLTSLCAEVDEKTHTQIAVVTVKTLDGMEASDFANQLFKHWGVGHKDVNRGVLMLVAINDHKYWTEVGYGLEPILPDGKVGGFGREMLPILRRGQYGAALLQISSQIAATIAKDRGITLTQGAPGTASPAESPEPSLFGIPPALLNLLVLLLIFGGWRFLAFLFAL